MSQFKTDIVILGAGIGGYETFRSLAKLLKHRGINKKITIVDRNNYFTFTPMLHEVASGSVEPQHCTIALRELVYNTPHSFLKATIHSINVSQKTVLTSQGELHYDYCVVALGSGVNYFNTPGAEQYCYGVRTLTAATKLHEELFQRLECEDQPELTLSVIGGGFTGVEVAGQFSYLINRDLKKLYPEKKLPFNSLKLEIAYLRFCHKKCNKECLLILQNRGYSFVLPRKLKRCAKENFCLLLENA
jgi:NADH dehydrogenase